MLKYNPFIHGTYLINKQKLISLGGYNEEYMYSQDYELMTRWLDYGYSFKYLRNVFIRQEKI